MLKLFAGNIYLAQSNCQRQGTLPDRITFCSHGGKSYSEKFGSLLRGGFFSIMRRKEYSNGPKMTWAEFANEHHVLFADTPTTTTISTTVILVHNNEFECRDIHDASGCHSGFFCGIHRMPCPY